MSVQALLWHKSIFEYSNLSLARGEQQCCGMRFSGPPQSRYPPKQQQLQTPYTTHKTTINGCMVIIYGHQFAISHTVRSARENDIEAHAMGIWFWLRHIYKFKTRRQCPYHHKMFNASLCVVCVSCVCRPQRQEFANGQRSPSYTSRTSSLGKIFLIAITLVALFFLYICVGA